MSLSEPTTLTGDILIIDDTLDNLRFLSDLLTKAGYTVRKVINGEMGLEASQLEPPDLILLDIQMPGLMGYEVCERLKCSDRTQHIPVIFLSAREEELDKVIAFETGGVDYITKPFQVVEVLSRIKTHLHISRLQQQLREQNEQLSQEIFQRTTAEAALRTLNQELKTRIESRTSELKDSNNHLQALQTTLSQILSEETQVSQLKSQLIATISNEFSTLLTTITPALELLKQHQKMCCEPEQQLVSLVSAQVAQMHQVLQNSVFLAESESALMLEPVNLTQACEGFVQQIQLPDQLRYQLTFEAQSHPVALVLTDQTLVLNILTQLVANALRYSPAGGTISLKLHYSATCATLVIQDHGIGIPESELPQIFDWFYRASNANTVPGPPSVGLGLAVVHQAIAHLNGSIVATSILGQGSVFTLQLPLTSPVSDS